MVYLERQSQYLEVGVDVSFVHDFSQPWQCVYYSNHGDEGAVTLRKYLVLPKHLFLTKTKSFCAYK